ncbi:MAG: quinoprotein dehydrogenase-associated SoxYZ-like carrier [Rhodocyclaceae bacterium]|nr:MAG: quinoprotein dehydrogenase-associated SoxYZ-like carrier [Rhodocyclaceae bacterium]
MRKQFFAGAKVVFDSRVKVAAPEVAEDPLNVPVTVDAAALADVETVLVFADFNPILRALAFTPRASLPYLGFRLKLQQSSPVRAAARTADGTWHVGGALVTTTGGGCTVPSTGSASPEWQQHLGEVSSRIWREDQDSRLRLRIIHPMDTGLSGTVPAFYLQQIDIKDGQGRTLMTIEPHEPVSENPVFTLRLPQRNGERLQVQGRDNNGNRFQAWVEQ